MGHIQKTEHLQSSSDNLVDELGRSGDVTEERKLLIDTDDAGNALLIRCSETERRLLL